MLFLSTQAAQQRQIGCLSSRYTVNHYHHRNTLYSVNVNKGTCAISVELAGPPEPSRHPIQLVPVEIRGMAGWVIDECAVGEDGSAGFVTNGLNSLLRISDALALRLVSQSLCDDA